MRAWIVVSVVTGIIVGFTVGAAFGFGCQTKCFVDQDGYVRCYRVCNGLS